MGGATPHRRILLFRKYVYIFAAISTYFRHSHLTALWSLLGTLRRCWCPTEATIFWIIISEPFPQKRIFRPHWWQNKLFRLPTLNKTNHSPVFQTNSNTVIQFTSFNIKPTKMLSDLVAEAFVLIHRHPSGENLLALLSLSKATGPHRQSKQSCQAFLSTNLLHLHLSAFLLHLPLISN